MSDVETFVIIDTIFFFKKCQMLMLLQLLTRYPLFSHQIVLKHIFCVSNIGYLLKFDTILPLKSCQKTSIHTNLTRRRQSKIFLILHFVGIHCVVLIEGKRGKYLVDVSSVLGGCVHPENEFRNTTHLKCLGHFLLEKAFG